MIPLHPTTLAHWLSRVTKHSQKRWVDHWMRHGLNGSDREASGALSIGCKRGQWFVQFSYSPVRYYLKKRDNFRKVQSLIVAYYEDYREK